MKSQFLRGQFTSDCPCVIIDKLMKMEEENLLKERETFGSRLGFILVSAGCAVGLGNVWKFPWACGQYGGGLFLLIYLICLIVLGIPVMIMEFSMGRASQASPVMMYRKLEKPGTKWHIHAKTPLRYSGV